jgi:hypothetical protein
MLCCSLHSFPTNISVVCIRILLLVIHEDIRIYMYISLVWYESTLLNNMLCTCMYMYANTVVELQYMIMIYTSVPTLCAMADPLRDINMHLLIYIVKWSEYCQSSIPVPHFMSYAVSEVHMNMEAAEAPLQHVRTCPACLAPPSISFWIKDGFNVAIVCISENLHCISLPKFKV